MLFAAAILSEPGVKRLVDIADQMNDKPKSSAFFIPWCVRRAEHLQIPGDCFDDAVAQFAIPLLVVCVHIFGKVDEVVRVHVGNLPPSFVRPCRCVLTLCLAGEALLSVCEKRR